MRTIKFRGLKDGTWHHLNIDGGGLYWSNELIRQLSEDNKITQFEAFCEFTGLYDKNGKEIYEGDILIPNFMWTTERLGCVEFNMAEFMVKAGGRFHHINSERMEVIGNIYEHPDLLEGK
jgi:hypothetical protein